MKSIDAISSWADETEAEIEGKKPLPPSSEVIHNGMKIITEYRYNDDDKLERVVRTYKIERRVFSKSVALRKSWKKYGDCAKDKPGVNPSNTFVGEEVQMQFITCKEDADKPEDDPLEKLKEQQRGLVKCRTCNGDHWTLTCPYKDMAPKLKPEEKLPPAGMSSTEDSNKSQSYVPPNLRDGPNAKRGDTWSSQRHGHDNLAIRISNLSPNTSDHDLEELVKPFGQIGKLYLAKEKNSQQCRGFAYVHFKNRADARSAIHNLDGYGYDHLILKADWSKPNEPKR